MSNVQYICQVQNKDGKWVDYCREQYSSDQVLKEVLENEGRRRGENFRARREDWESFPDRPYYIYPGTDYLLGGLCPGCKAKAIEYPDGGAHGSICQCSNCKERTIIL